MENVIIERAIAHREKVLADLYRRAGEHDIFQEEIAKSEAVLAVLRRQLSELDDSKE